MKQQFIPLTPQEMFFGIIPKTNLTSGGTLNSSELISKVASTPTNQTYISPTPNVSINTDVIAQQQIGFVLSDFLWKHRWEIGLGVVVIGGAILYRYSLKEREDDQKKTSNRESSGTKI